jgi:hypothetical protein
MTKGEWVEIVLLGIVTVAIGIASCYVLFLFMQYLYSIGH